MSDSKPGLITIYLQLMKLRVVILLQITAICAILAHDLMVRSEALSGDRTCHSAFQQRGRLLRQPTRSKGGRQ